MLAVEWSAPGMSLTGGRPVRVDDGWHEVGVWLPDLTDPATLGCLVALVREAWNSLVVISLGAGWWSVQTDLKDWDQGNTESFVDALVLTLERA